MMGLVSLQEEEATQDLSRSLSHSLSFSPRPQSFSTPGKDLVKTYPGRGLHQELNYAGTLILLGQNYEK